MSSNMQQWSDLKAEVVALASEVAQLKATQPNLSRFASEIGTHLVKFETDVTRNFTDKFAGNFFRATEAFTARVANLEERADKLEQMLSDQLTKYDELLKEHRARVSKLYKSHADGVEKLLANNAKTLAAQQAAVNQTLAVAQNYDKHFVELHNAHYSLLQWSEETSAKVDAAVEKFDQISVGALKDVGAEAQLAIKELSAGAQRHIVTTRRRFIKVMSGFDDKLSQHPVLLLVLLIAAISFFFGLFGNVAGRRIVKDNAQEMINESVAKAVDTINERIDPKIEELQKMEHSLGMTFDDAQMCDALTANMSYEEKLAYIKKAQAEIQRRGQTLRSQRQ